MNIEMTGINMVLKKLLVAGAIVMVSMLVKAEQPIVLDPSYSHDKWVTLPRDVVKSFRAFTASMDSKDNDDGYQEGEADGTPEWVAYEIKAYTKSCIPTAKRPDWAAAPEFVRAGIAPNDNSYQYSRAFRSAHKDWYVRGHLQMKLIAERMGHDAAANTHTFLNAVPQRSQFNGGIWLDLEYITTAWADSYGSVWVITGPIYPDNKAAGYLGEENEFPVAIPDALFKIVVKESAIIGQPDVLAFIYPQVGPGYNSKQYDHTRFLTSVDEIEQLTGLDFLTSLNDEVEQKVEADASRILWPYDKADIVMACKRNELPE